MSKPNQSPAEAELEEALARIFDEYHGEFWNGNMLYAVQQLFTQHHQALLQKIEEAMPKKYVNWKDVPDGYFNLPSYHSKLVYRKAHNRAVDESTNILNQAREGKL